MAKPSERLLKELTTQINGCIARVALVIRVEGLDHTTPVDLKSLIRDPETLHIDATKVKDLYVRWLAERLLDIYTLVSSITNNLERIAVQRKAGQPTDELYENKVTAAKDKIEQNFGVLYCIDKIFEDNRTDDKHRLEVLYLVQEIQARVRLIRQRLNMLLNPFLAVFTSRWAVIALLALFMALVPILYVVRSWREAGQVDSAAVEQKIQSDAGGLQNAASTPDASLLDKMVAVTKKVSEITSTIPNILLLSAVVLSVVRRFVLRCSWQHPKLQGYEEQFRELARSLQGDLKGK